MRVLAYILIKDNRVEWIRGKKMKMNEDKLKVIEERLNALEVAFEALLKKEEMSKLNLSGGDGEWY